MSKDDQKLASPRSQRLQHEAEAALTGVIAGAAAGAVGGPPGAVAGAVVGGVVGVLAGLALERGAADAAARDAALDEEIGVMGGELGAPNLDHPPSSRGTFSVASAGGGTGRPSQPSAEGPMQSPE